MFVLTRECKCYACEGTHDVAIPFPADRLETYTFDCPETGESVYIAGLPFSPFKTATSCPDGYVEAKKS